MSSIISSFIIAGTGSGVGKTTISLALGRALKRRGLKVRPFKVGPDYIDPRFLKRATGCDCYNLDTWMTSESYISNLYTDKLSGHDVAMVEGVMGLFDGARVTSSYGSTAHVSKVLHSPVILVVHAKGAARSICAMVKGFCEFEPDLNVVGVIANYVGSARHGEMIKEALFHAGLPPLVGAVCNGSLPTFGERHLGLVGADEYREFDLIADIASEVIEDCVDIDEILKMTEQQVDCVNDNCVYPSECTIGIAHDQAFSFYYPDNIESFKRNGIRPVFFSPLNDQVVPSVDALYFPGGYPELYSNELSSNKTMLESVRRFSKSGKVIYGECGGLLYLGREINGHELVALFNSKSSMNQKLKRLGYCSLRPDGIIPWGNVTLRGHMFHYSSLETGDDVKKPFFIERKGKVTQEGVRVNNSFASYFHGHWASNDEAIINFKNFIISNRD